MSQGRRYIKIGFLGPEATYSHQAALQHFSINVQAESAQLLPIATIDALFIAVCEGEVDFSVVPLSNSTNGSVEQTLKAIIALSPARSIEVCGATSVSVRHCLAGRQRGWNNRSESQSHDTTDDSIFSHIKSLHTHPQAWSQCTPFLTKHFGEAVHRQSENSTSEAAAKVAADQTGGSAAICSKLAAQMFGLDILADEIQSSNDNTTRFLVLCQRAGQVRTTMTIDPSSSKVEALYVCEVDPSALNGFGHDLAHATAGVLAYTSLHMDNWRLVFATAPADSTKKVEWLAKALEGFVAHVYPWGRWHLL